MCLTYRAGLAIVMIVGSFVAPGKVLDRTGVRAGTVVAASTNPSTPGRQGEDGEIWVTAQNASELKILHGMGGIETVALPPGAAPHTINFSPDGSYAYVSNLGNGSLIVVRADDREIVATLNLGPTFAHDTKASPDGSILLSANPMTRILTKIAADEGAETWAPAGSLDLGAAIGRGPVCVVFRSDGERAYASLAPSGVAVVDVPTMTLLGTLPTAGSVACGLVNSKDGRTIFVDSDGGTGHFYRLNTDTDTLTEATGYGAIGSQLHGFLITAGEKAAYIAARATDEVKVLNLNGTDVSTISVDSRPGVADEPHNLARRGSTLYVTLRFAGQVARINSQSGRVDYIDVAPPAASGYAVHGIAVRP